MPTLPTLLLIVIRRRRCAGGRVRGIEVAEEEREVDVAHTGGGVDGEAGNELACFVCRWLVLCLEWNRLFVYM